jgi:hypothetical protein
MTALGELINRLLLADSTHNIIETIMAILADIQPFAAIALTVSYEHDEMTGGSASGKTKQNLRPGCSVD